MDSNKMDVASNGKNPSLVARENGGALLTGGVPGNKGGGRPPSAVRVAMREAFADRVHILCEIADDADKYTASDRMKALDLLGKYGLGARFALEVAAKMAKRNGDPRLEAEEADEDL